ncbi:MAG TPA: ATP-binding protein [Streptosporangiaceae bacterium]
MVRAVAWGTAEFTAVLEAVPDAVVCVDPDGRISLVNTLAGRLFGYPPGELAGLPVEVLIPESARARHRQAREAYQAAPGRRPMGAAQAELAGRRRDGSTFRAEISLAPIPGGADPEEDGQFGVLAVIRDSTQRLAAEEERARLEFLADRAQLERQVGEAQRLEGLGQLAGGMAHDFNNLLAVISSYASFVHQEVASEPPTAKWHKVSQDLEELENAADRAAALTRQLLAYSRTQQAEPQVLDLNEVIRGLADLLGRTMGPQIQLGLELDPELGRVLADHGQLEQVLVNLAVNARDAMPDGGRLTIRTADTAVDDPDLPGLDCGRPGRFARLEVGDTGGGMRPEVASRVFEPFFTTKPSGQGAGLGLATVHGIIRRAGGRLEVSSAPGRGTTMTVLLPVTEAAARCPAAAGPAQPLRGSGELVLVVEDEASIREATRRVLAGHGYRVLTAACGEEALAIAAREPEPVDVLLTDVMMPNMLGTEVAERLRGMQPGLRVLFMSGYAQGLLSAQGTLPSGAPGAVQPRMELIEKPFTHPDLLAKVREVLAAPAGDHHG